MNHNRSNAEPAGLAADLPLAREQYEQIESDLIDLLDPALGPLPRRLVAQSAYLTILAKFLRQARSAQQQLAAGPEANAEAFEVFRRKMRGTQEQPWLLPLSIANKKRSAPRLRRMALGFAHALGSVSSAQRGRMRLYCIAISAYFQYAFGRGRLALPGIQRQLRWRDIGRVQFDPARPDFDELLTPYFRNRLARKELLTAEDLQWGHHLMLLHWGLIHWYSALLAAEAGSATIELECLRGGIEKVEEIFVRPATFDKLFGRYSMLRGFLDRMFQHPHYAFSMAWGEWAEERNDE
jgi:hypothetical protein